MKRPFAWPVAYQQIEDFIGRTLLLIWFLTVTYRQSLNLVHDASLSGTTEPWLLDSVHSFLVLAFGGLSAILTIVRKPANAVASGLEPRISAILGTYLMLTLPLLPQSHVSVGVKLLSVVVTTAGLVLSIYCLFWLGRSWSIMATARRLVTGGPYRLVRHPLYASEMITMIGVALGYLSIPALLLVLAALAFTLRRTVNEERVLRAAFPEYDEYARNVPRIIPKIDFSRATEPEAPVATEATRRP